MRRRLAFPSYEAALAEIDRLIGGYRKTGSWNLPQICDHLRNAFDGSINGFDFSAAWLPRKLFGRIGLWTVFMTRRIPSGVKIPRRFCPASSDDVLAAKERLRSAIEKFEAHDGPCHPHPFFGGLSHAQWRRLHLLHMAHHLSYLEPVVTADIAPG